MWEDDEEDPQFKVHAHLKYLYAGGSVAQHPLEVGIFPRGTSKHGLLDLIGNVYEVVSSPSSWSEYALAGGAWTTAFSPRGRFHKISGWVSGHENVDLRPVLDIIFNDN